MSSIGDSDLHPLRSGRLSAIVRAHGAELSSLRHDVGTEFVWQAGAAWPRHAPLLFPIVGRLASDTLRHRGKVFRMTQHGFARDSRFVWAGRGDRHCTLVLEDSKATRAHYPFAFRLTATYALDDTGLDLTLTVANPGDEILPASLGGHPAFNWPLRPGLAKESYSLSFPSEEQSPVRRLAAGLLKPQPEPTPVKRCVLPLSEALFADDALIFDRIASSSVRLASTQDAAGPRIEIAWTGFRELGVWSKPSGAPFLCIEPWRGYASPTDFDGEFTDKPGLMHIAPGGEERLSFRIDVGGV